MEIIPILYLVIFVLIGLIAALGCYYMFLNRKKVEKQEEKVEIISGSEKSKEEKKKQEAQTGNSESHLLRKILFITVIIFGCIAIIPSPLVLIASSMSAGGGSIHWSDPLELLIRFLWILTIFYPVYIALPFFWGRELIIKKKMVNLIHILIM